MKILFCLLLFAISFAQAQTKKSIDQRVLNELVDKNGFENEKIFNRRLNDYPDFLKEILENNLISLYGVLYNNNFYNAGQLENTSCSGQQIDFLKNQNFDGLEGMKKNNIKVFDGINIDPNKKIIVFLYSRNSSKYILKKIIKPVFNEIKKDANYDYIMLVID